MTNQNIPEKLNLWDRMFNRYRKVIVSEHVEKWHKTTLEGYPVPGTDFTRNFVKYRIIDRLTGSEKLVKEYI